MHRQHARGALRNASQDMFATQSEPRPSSDEAFSADKNNIIESRASPLMPKELFEILVVVLADRKYIRDGDGHRELHT